jgi:hypothetical protein
MGNMQYINDGHCVRTSMSHPLNSQSVCEYFEVYFLWLGDNIGSEVLTAVVMKSCILLEVNRRFRGSCSIQSKHNSACHLLSTLVTFKAYCSTLKMEATWLYIQRYYA